MRRTELRSHYRNTGPSAAAVELVLERDLWSCVVCGELVGGERGTGWSIQHRVRRGQGSTRRPWINLPGNLALICGSGTTGCHGEVEVNPMWATVRGWRVKDGLTLPSQTIMLHSARGIWLWLDDLGGVSESPPEVAA